MKSVEIERHLIAVETIVRSPWVEQYLVGLTHWDARKKSGTYYRQEFDHFITIASPLTPKSALQLEQAIFEYCTKNKKSILYGKYHHEKRDGIYHPSLGGKKHEEKTPMLVYMAWWNKARS